MNASVIFFQYLAWHYSEGIKEFSKAWRNIHWFLYHFFSVHILVRTFFQPLHRLSESYGRGFDPGKFFEALTVNVVMRLVGMIIRTGVIAVAVIVEIGAFISGVLLLVLFVAAPVFVPAGIIGGITLMIS